MSVLERSKTYKPFQYAWAINFAETSEKMHWVEQEVDLTEDVRQWNDGTITKSEKNLILEIMKTFTQSDTEVASGYVEYFLPVFKNNEIRQMLISFTSREGIHQRAYALFNDTIGLPDDSYSLFLDDYEMKNKIFQMTEMDTSSYKNIAKSIARTIISEGISLFGAFVMLLNFQRYGKLLGLSKINEWSIKDETLHLEGMVYLFHEFLKEHPRIVTDEFKSDIYVMFTNALKLEERFVDIAFSMGNIEGLCKKDVKKYLKYITDRRLLQLGLKGINNVKENPLPWLDYIISGDNLTNFFEQRVADYSTVGMSGDWGW